MDRYGIGRWSRMNCKTDPDGASYQGSPWHIQTPPPLPVHRELHLPSSHGYPKARSGRNTTNPKQARVKDRMILWGCPETDGGWVSPSEQRVQCLPVVLTRRSVVHSTDSREAVRTWCCAVRCRLLQLLKLRPEPSAAVPLRPHASISAPHAAAQKIGAPHPGFIHCLEMDTCSMITPPDEWQPYWARQTGGMTLAQHQDDLWPDMNLSHGQTTLKAQMDIYARESTTVWWSHELLICVCFGQWSIHHVTVKQGP